MKEKKFNHIFTIAFSVDTDNDGENVTKEELMDSLRAKVSELEQTGEIEDMVGLPIETFEN